MDTEKGLWEVSKVLAPDFPRNSSDHLTIQAPRYNRGNFCECLQRAMENEMPGYYSVYSFPRGHSQDGNIPKVDCVFIDLDVEGGDYDPNDGDTSFDAWKRDMSALLARSRMIARAIIEEEQEKHFRAVLSGHKGLHIYLDFPTVAPSNGSFAQFKTGLKNYGESVMSWLDSTAGGVNIDPWVDVDASDLGRLARHPNTIHHGAKYDDTQRWCVPITMEELADLHVEDYLELTTGPRLPENYERVPSKSAGNKVVQAIRTAPETTTPTSRGRPSEPNPQAVKEYEEQSNDDIEVEDIGFLTANYPCIEAFVERDDAFHHGNSSHLMEVNMIGKLVELNVPRGVIHEFMEDIPGYSEAQTDEQIDKVISRSISSFNCTNIASKAPMFCLGNSCSVYQRNDDIQR